MTLLLVVAVATVTLGLGSMAAELAGDTSAGLTPPLARPAPQAGRERIAEPGQAVSSGHDRPGALLAQQLRQAEADPHPRTHAGTATQPPRHEADPRIYLAQMAAIEHRQGLPLPGDVGRLQSVFVAETPPAPCFSPRYCPTHSGP